MSDPRPVVPSPVVFVAAYIVAYYTAAGRYVVADFDGTAEPGSSPARIAVYETPDEYAAWTDVGGIDPGIVFVVRPSVIEPGGVNIFVVDDDGRESFHASVAVPSSYTDVRDACENGVAFD